jgi:glycosyltransferase involved in cell wall biosynthesis
VGANHLNLHPLHVKAIYPPLSAEGAEVLHYVGYDNDRGGIISVLRALSHECRFKTVLGVNRGFVQSKQEPLPVLEFLPVKGESLGLGTFWNAFNVSRVVLDWLSADQNRIFHGHSRAGLAVALWLAKTGESRIAASIHCYGRQRWFYRWSARRLGTRQFWLSPAMKRYYGSSEDSWQQCIPGCIPSDFSTSPLRQNNLSQIVRFGGIGSLVKWKRWDLILEALAAVPIGVRKKFCFTHIGSGDGTPASKRLAASLVVRTKELGLEGVVTWKGQQPSSRAFLAEIDCLVVASENEPFSIAMLESLASGIPVLASDTGGARDIIVSGQNGWLFRSGNVNDLASHFSKLTEHFQPPASNQNRASTDKFRADVVALQWSQVYANLLNFK